MTSPLLDALIGSPILPELIQEAQRVFEKERLLREKFYADITPEHKWEFIQGEVVMHSPALNRHPMATKRLFKLLDSHVQVLNLGLVHMEKAMTCFPRNDYEPDIMFFGLVKFALIHADTLKFPIPDLIVEVPSPSTEHRDRGIKFQDYALHGVEEYWIIDPVAETVELHRLPKGADVYPEVEKQPDGMLSSEVVPGFQIPVRAIFDEDENARSMKAIWSAKS
ncbi:Uma2 family endonuclease [Brevifollis gellanilyticus]|uniref:Putative restriction endonuclease domain-containing protein n=1 Tax=Brevifollis gellanilyticus TaxID=748831 RepID=A0A512M764_9BACT|nr:Uma2 family endonuclease [Brevifollis gellanilyticus]GEP42565.1 hypothetical protein BGE01nite_18560 [Brevifollis gellanilyticus]